VLAKFNAAVAASGREVILENSSIVVDESKWGKGTFDEDGVGHTPVCQDWIVTEGGGGGGGNAPQTKGKIFRRDLCCLF